MWAQEIKQPASTLSVYTINIIRTMLYPNNSKHYQLTMIGQI